MDWKKLPVYATGSVDEELRLRNEYLVTENRILRDQISGRPKLTDVLRVTTFRTSSHGTPSPDGVS